MLGVVYFTRRRVRRHYKDEREKVTGHGSVQYRNPERYMRLQLQLERMPICIHDTRYAASASGARAVAGGECGVGGLLILAVGLSLPSCSLFVNLG